MERQTIIIIIVVSLLIIIAAICIWYFLYRTPKDNVKTSTNDVSTNNTTNNDPINDTSINDPINDTSINDTSINDPINDASIYAPIDSTLTHAPVNNTLIDDTIQDIFPSNETIYVPVSGIFINTPVYEITENTREEDKDVLTARGHSVDVQNTWGRDKCFRKLLFDFAIPLNIKSLRMECKVRTNKPQESTDAYIVFRNKTTNKTQYIRTTNFSLTTAWQNVSITNTDLLNSGYLIGNVVPHPGHEIEIYAQACYAGWRIDVKEAKLIYEL